MPSAWKALAEQTSLHIQCSRDARHMPSSEGFRKKNSLENGKTRSDVINSCRAAIIIMTFKQRAEKN